MRRRRGAPPNVGWDSITLADVEGIPASGPSPADLAAILIDGGTGIEPGEAPMALRFLDALKPPALRNALFLSIVRGYGYTQRELAKEAGITQSAVSQALRRAAVQVWGNRWDKGA